MTVTVNNSACPRQPWATGCMLPHGMMKDRPGGLCVFCWP